MKIKENYNNFKLLRYGLTLFPILMTAAAPTYAIDGVALELGRSFSTHDIDTDLARVGVQWEWGRKWQISDDWSLGGYWEAAFGYWHTNGRLDNYETLDFGLTPVFRLQRVSALYGVLPYLEFAIGAHLLTERQISDRIHFSTSFQFGDQAAVGLRFGAHGRYDLSVGVQHLSNAGIDHPNPGINFSQLRFQYHF